MTMHVAIVAAAAKVSKCDILYMLFDNASQFTPVLFDRALAFELETSCSYLHSM